MPAVGDGEDLACIRVAVSDFPGVGPEDEVNLFDVFGFAAPRRD